MSAFFRKLLSPVVELRENEFATALMMFTYSFLVMAAYNALKPVTRSQFIKDLGADNLPLVQFAFGLAVGFMMQGYSAIVGRLPRRWALPMTLGGLAGLLVVFWLWFQSGSHVGVHRLLLLRADPRHPGHQPVLDAGQRGVRPAAGQAPLRVHRRAAPAWAASPGRALRCRPSGIGTSNLLLVSAGMLMPLPDAGGRDHRAGEAGDQRLAHGRRRGRASAAPRRCGCCVNSKHLQTIALIIAFAAIGAAIVEQQLNMATAQAKGQTNTDRHHQFSGRGAALHVDHRVRHPGLAGEQDPALPGHRLRLADSADQPGDDRHDHAAQRRAAGRRRWRASSTRRCATPSTRPRARFSSCRCPTISSSRPSRSSTSRSTALPRALARCWCWC